MTRIGILQGLKMARRKRRTRTKQSSKMKTCAVKWKRSGKKGKYTSFMRTCLKK